MIGKLTIMLLMLVVHRLVLDLATLVHRVHRTEHAAAFVTVYEGAPHRIVCRHFKPGSLRIPTGGKLVGDAWVFTKEGVTVVVHEDGGVVCCMASVMPPDEFLRVLSKGVVQETKGVAPEAAGGPGSRLI